MRLSVIITALTLSLLGLAAQAQDKPPARVVVTEVQEQEVHPTSHMTGVLRFDRVTHLSPEVSGQIKAMRLTDGLHVKQGEMVAEISGDFLRQDIAIAEAEIGDVEAQIAQKAAELKRLSALEKSNVASKSAYDEALYGLRALRARKKATQLRVERLKLELERGTIRAPFDGVVLERSQDVGEWAKPETSLGRLAATEYVLAVFPIAEAFVPYQVMGAEMEVTIPALRKTLTGKLHGFVSTTEVRTKSVYLKVELPYEDGMLENLSVEADIPTGEHRILRTLPRAALIQAPGKPTVYTITDGKAEAVKFDIAARIGDQVASNDDAIKPGMKVVIDGNDRLRPGQAVQVVDPEAEQ